METDRLIALAYHAVDEGGDVLSTPPAVFLQQLECLKMKGLRGCSARDYFEDPDAEKVVLTFDDGTEDFLQTVVPMLNEFGFTATVFVIAGRLSGNSEWPSAKNDFSRRLMSGNEIAACSKGGMEIGSHTLTHANLLRCSEEQLSDELSKSRPILEDVSGKPVVSFAFPYGRENGHIVKSARMHYRHLFTTGHGYATRREDECHRRIEMHYYRDSAKFTKLILGQDALNLQMRRAMRACRRLFI